MGQAFAFQNGAKEVLKFALNLKNTNKLQYVNETPLEFANSIYNAQNKENNGRDEI